MVRLFGIVPLGIGLTVLGFLWLTPFHEFGSPPLFFRLFGSFVALPFVFVGAAALFGNPESWAKARIEQARRLRNLAQEAGLSENRPAQPGSSAGYVCPSCNAPLGEKADVSPSGDVKCLHCGRWFNIHA
jgi:hypothetical protein